MFPSDRLPLAERYAELLATDGVVRGLIGPREAPRLWDRHLVNCALLAELIPEGATVCDIGSGAGLPGLVLAIARPDLRSPWSSRCCAGPPSSRRSSAELGLANVEVVRGRAEALHGTRTFDVVTSRAVAPLDRLLGWSMPLVAPTGALVAMKGSSVAEEIEAARPMLGAVGLCRAGGARSSGDGLAGVHRRSPSGWPGPTRAGYLGRLRRVRPTSRESAGRGPVDREAEAQDVTDDAGPGAEFSTGPETPR